MFTPTWIALAVSLSMVQAAPTEIDRQVLAEERTTAAGAEHARSLASLFYPNKFTHGPTYEIPQDIKSTWTDVANYAGMSYCGPAQVNAWDCGPHCSSLPRPKSLFFGGDDGATPYYFVANNGTHVIVSIAGTNTKSPASLANDLNVILRKAPPNYFPGANKSEVHTGFYGAFTRLAGPVAAAVQSEVAAGTRQVIVTGHSLGAAVGELLAVHLARLLGGSATVTARLFASPRVGNVPWSLYVEATFPHASLQYLTNYNDPIPHLPPKNWGYRHPSNEIWIPAVGSSQMIACSGSENKRCADQFSDPGSFFTSLKDWISSNVHDGPYAGVMMGSGNCKK